MHNGFVVTDKLKNHKQYDGNTVKFGITVNHTDYIVKLPQKGTHSVITEYIASRFIASLGILSHEVWVGVYKDEYVSLLKDFTNRTAYLRTFKDTRQSSEGTDLTTKTYTYDDVLYLVSKHNKMNDLTKRQMLNQFWQMYICDAILGNRDRHHGNWGYLTSNGQSWPAPIFDNGASLFPNVDLTDFPKDKYAFLSLRSETFPASLFCMKREDGSVKRTNYYAILSDLRINKTLARNVRELKEKIGFDGVYTRIVSIVYDKKLPCSPIHREFLVAIVCMRYLHMIERLPLDKAYTKTYGKMANSRR